MGILVAVGFVLFASCVGGQRPEADRRVAVEILDAEVTRDGRTLILYTDSCQQEEAAAVEVVSATNVTVSATAIDSGPERLDCAGSATLRIDRPLGRRTLTDDTTGKVLRVAKAVED